MKRQNGTTENVIVKERKRASDVLLSLREGLKSRRSNLKTLLDCFVTNVPRNDIKVKVFSLFVFVKRILYLEIILKQTSLSLYFVINLFKKYNLSFKKVFLTFLCLKFLLNPFLIIPVKAQETNDFSLITLQSNPVSFLTTPTPSAITLGSLPASFSLTNYASSIKLSSLPISFNTTLTPTNITLSSLPVSYNISNFAEKIMLSSIPVSYSLSTFSGEKLSLSSSPVSYKTYNGLPILELVSPNLLPISKDAKSTEVTLKGDNFVNGSIASIGTLKINTKYISQKEVLATVPGEFLNKENSFELFISNPPPQGGVSMGFNVRVVDPIPIAKLKMPGKYVLSLVSQA